MVKEMMLVMGASTSSSLQEKARTSSSLGEDAQEVSGLQGEEHSRDCILATPKRKATWPRLMNNCKKMRLEMTFIADVVSLESLEKCSFVDLIVVSRTTQSQHGCEERYDVAKEHHPKIASTNKEYY